MAFCERDWSNSASKSNRVTHLLEHDLGVASESAVNFSRQHTVEESKFNIDAVHDLNWSCFCVDSSIGPCGRFFRDWEKLCVYAKKEASNSSMSSKSQLHRLRSKHAPTYDEEKCFASFRQFMDCTMSHPDIRPWAASLKKYSQKSSDGDKSADSDQNC